MPSFKQQFGTSESDASSPLDRNLVSSAEVPPFVDDSPLKPYANGAIVDKSKAVKIKLDTFTPFPLDCLPSVLRRFVTEVSKAIGCDTAFSVLPALAVCAAAIGTSRSLMIKRGWFVATTLWGLVVGESGS
ncbi:MAG: hypothetical protein ABGZ53_31025, partial [Fuerstiella sp.]